MPQVKPRVPIPDWSHPLMRGRRLYLPLAEGVGTPCDLSPARAAVTITGTLTWGSGPLGPHLTGWSSSNYVDLSAATGDLYATFPSWQAVGFRNSATGDQSLISCGSSVASARYANIRINGDNVAGRLYSLIWGDGGLTVLQADGLPLNDGGLHVAATVSLASNAHRIYFDGRLVGTSSTDVGATAFDRATVGVTYSAGVDYVAHSSTAIWAAEMGAGPGLPDMQALAADWLSGAFAPIRPRRSLVSLYVPAAGPAFQPAWAAGSAANISWGLIP